MIIDISLVLYEKKTNKKIIIISISIDILNYKIKNKYGSEN